MANITGTSADNTLTGTAGSDLISAGAGDDTIIGAGGSDTVDGGSGNDTITTGAGNDLIDGGAGNDVISAGGGTNTVDGGAGNDTITTGDGDDLIDGGAGNDVIDAGDGTNIVDSGAGNDTIITGGGHDLIDAGAGNDAIDSGGGCDLVLAGAGDDHVSYTRLAGNDDLSVFAGEAGRDTLRITVSRSEYDTNVTLRAEIAAYQAFLASSNAQQGSFTFTFGNGEARLTATQFERLELVITGSSNTTPVANADTGTVGENETVSFDVLANDTDADAGDSKTLQSLGSPSVTSTNSAVNGLDAAAAFTVVGNQIQFAPGTLFDALAVGQTATATISYTMRDAAGATATSTLTLTITGSNDAPVVTGDVVAAIGEDDAGPAMIALLANASDIDGDDLDAAEVSYAVTGGAWGSPVLYSIDGETGLLSLDAAQFEGLGEGDTIELTFSYSVADGNGGNTPATAVVTVTGTGDAPVIAAGNDTGAVVEDGAPVSSGDLEVSDADIGDTTSWTAGPATYGEATVDPDTGAWTYTLNNMLAAVQGLGEGDTLIDGVTVTVIDSDGLTDERVVNVTITGTGDDPVIAAGSDTGTVVEDGVLIASGNLDVSDVDTADTAEWSADSAAYGLAAVDAETGEWTYTLNNALAAVQNLNEGETLADSFTITVIDSDGLTATRVVNITIEGTADGHPTAFSDTLFTNAGAGTTLSIANAWLVRNDVDPTNDPLNVGAATGGIHVDQVTAGPASTGIRVNIAAGGSGDFSYTATDGALSSGPAIVAVSRGVADTAIVGGAGNDILIDGRADLASTTMDGGAGSDIVVGGSRTNVLVGDQGDLLIDGGGGSDTLQVAVGFDDASDEQLVNVEGATLASGASLDLAQQTEGFTVVGEAGSETIVTGSGNDTIAGGLGADNLTSGTGNDIFVFNSVGGTSSDSSRVVVAGNSNDRGQDTITGFNFATDVIRIVATNIGRFEHGADTAIGTASSPIGAAASDFNTSTGLIQLDGGPQFADVGDIVLTFASPSAPLSEANFQARLQYKLTGTADANFFLGGDLNDIINGGGNFDTIRGGAGDDILIGGTAGDRLNGNAGADQYWLQVSNQQDAIETYSTIDKVGLRASDSNFANTVGSANGTALSAADFVVRSSAGAITAADSHKVVMLTNGAALPATIAGLLDSYVLNISGGSTVLWYDNNWGDTTGRNALAVFEDVDTLADFNATFTVADFVVWTNGIDPILLDLDGNGYAFDGLDHGRSFDIDGDGATDTVAWNTSGDGMLAIDFNRNGVIDDGTELFTPSLGGGSFASGGEALAALDTNGDGAVDALDELFVDLLIWRDVDADGVTDAGELAILADHGILSIAVPSHSAVGQIDGQELIGEGSFTRSDGTAGSYVEIALEADLGGGDDFWL